MSIWTDFGFKGSPYSTEPIEASHSGEYLLVGRDKELQILKDYLTSSALHPTIEGDNGVGKTSLVAVASYGLMNDFSEGRSRDALIPLAKPFQISSSDTAESFASQVAYAVANAFIEHHDLLVRRGLKAPATGDINKWLNNPIIKGGGGGLTIAGYGGNVTATAAANGSHGFSEAGFAATINRWLSECFPSREAGGFVGIIDNLELLETSKTARALLESMRDSVLNMPGVRWVLCGARGIVRTGASSPRLEGRLTRPMELEPINDDEVAEAVNRRISMYRVEKDAPAPVGPQGFSYIYDVLNRNLRNTLKYCEDFSFWLRNNMPSERTAEEYYRLLLVWLANEAQAHLSDTTLGGRAWAVFDQLAAWNGSVSPSDHAEFDFKTPEAMRPQIKALEDMSLVQSSVDESDKRRRTIVMTPRAWLVHYARNGCRLPEEVTETVAR